MHRAGNCQQYWTKSEPLAPLYGVLVSNHRQICRSHAELSGRLARPAAALSGSLRPPELVETYSEFLGRLHTYSISSDPLSTLRLAYELLNKASFAFAPLHHDRMAEAQLLSRGGWVSRIEIPRLVLRSCSSQASFQTQPTALQAMKS